jgi:hypothetical protein
VVSLWFVALLLLASAGWSRWLGGAVMLVVVGLEVATFVTLVLGAPMGSVKLLILLPFVWLLLESAKRVPGRRGGTSSPVTVTGTVDHQ